MLNKKDFLKICIDISISDYAPKSDRNIGKHCRHGNAWVWARLPLALSLLQTNIHLFFSAYIMEWQQVLRFYVPSTGEKVIKRR